MEQKARVGIDISSKADTRGFKVAETALQKLNKSVKSLAASFGLAYGTRAIVNFGKASVRAFAADEKAAKSLEIALKNTGNGFATIATEGFIARMQQTYKVLDDDLRPAFQTLLTATGDLGKSQTALELALNVSAGTGKDLQTVSLALSKAYSGQTTALSKLGAGISAATIKSGDMNKIIAELTSKFQGQALAATKTYSGQIAALGVAAQNSKEIIGKGLLDALVALGTDKSIENLTTGMEDFATGIAEVIKEIGLLSAAISSVPVLGELIGLLFKSSPLGLLIKLGGDTKKANMGKGVAYSGTSQYFTVESAERAKNTAILKKNNATLTASQKLAAADLAAKNKALADQANLDELKKKFDVGRINLETALANSKDEAEKARIRSLLTIMDDDAAAAGKRLAELDKANSDKLRAEYLAALSLNNLAEAAKYAAMGVGKLTLGGVPITQFPSVASNPVVADAVVIEATIAADEASKAADDAAAIAASSEKTLADYLATMAGLGSNTGIAAGSVTNNFDFSGTIATADDFADAVKRALQKMNRFGDSTTYAGAIA